MAYFYEFLQKMSGKVVKSYERMAIPSVTTGLYVLMENFKMGLKSWNECRRQSQQNIVFNPEQVQVNVDSPFNALLGSIKLVL